MFCQAAFDQWQTTIMCHLSHFSKTQAPVMAVLSFGMVLARSCALSAVSSLLAEGMQCSGQTVRQRLREWYYDPPCKRGPKRQTPASRPVLPRCCAGWCAGARVRKRGLSY
jgi:hypothetical protein